MKAKKGSIAYAILGLLAFAICPLLYIFNKAYAKKAALLLQNQLHKMGY